MPLPYCTSLVLNQAAGSSPPPPPQPQQQRPVASMTPAPINDPALQHFFASVLMQPSSVRAPSCLSNSSTASSAASAPLSVAPVAVGNAASAPALDLDPPSQQFAFPTRVRSVMHVFRQNTAISLHSPLYSVKFSPLILFSCVNKQVNRG